MVARRSRSSARASSPTFGSHQSSAEVEAIVPEQHVALTAAAARKAGKARLAGVAKPKKLFKFARVTSSSASGTGSSKSHAKKATAMIEFVRAKYQKGEKKDVLTGSVIARFKTRFKQNDASKEKVQAKSLIERARWNDEIVKYTLRAWSVEQAIMYGEALKMVSAEAEADINKFGPTDDQIAEVFDFPG